MLQMKHAADEMLSVTLCEQTMLEATPEAPEPQRSIPDRSSNEGYGNVGSMPIPVTSEDFNGSGELRVIERKA